MAAALFLALCLVVHIAWCFVWAYGDQKRETARLRGIKRAALDSARARREEAELAYQRWLDSNPPPP